MKTSIVIPTYRRGAVLLQSVRLLLQQDPVADEILVVDQTPRHDVDIEAQLAAWERGGLVRWIRRATPSITAAMNGGLLAAKGDWVLFLDDDTVPSDGLVAGHAAAVASHPEAWAVAGQVLQPGESPSEACAETRTRFLWQDLEFRFNGARPGWVTNGMAGNLCVRREKAIALGGFDEQFGPPVAYRFETEFAKRIIQHGGKIWFEPKASVRHLRTPSGGTRSQGSHLTSPSPVHGVGDYYYALRCGRGWERAWYMVRRPFREVGTRFHLCHPWWIPVKIVGELRALALALRLYRNGPRLLDVAAANRAF